MADPTTASIAASSAEAMRAASAPAPVGTVRPTKTDVVCTRPPGAVQTDAHAINRTRLSCGGDESRNSRNVDPAGGVHRYSADVASAHPISPRLRIDLGGKSVLDRFTPGTQVDAAILARF